VKSKPTKLHFFILIILTLLFFSANSILAKTALLNNYMDAYSFTLFRLIFGAFTLVIIVYFKTHNIALSKTNNWLSSFMLFLYAICFSYAYLTLDAGLGALLLFGIVQLTMIGFAYVKKEPFGIRKLLGVAIAFAGLIYLLLPKEDFEISLFHASLMIVSGFAWAVYTLLGKQTQDALVHTMDNFVKTSIFLLLFYILFVDDMFITIEGLALAFVSGSITSAIGYSVWYYILPHVKIITAGIVQLLVPIIALFFSILLLGEHLTFTLIIATISILLGIFITLKDK